MKKIKKTSLVSFVIIAVIFGLGCSKSIIETNVIIDAMTNGRWIVAQFKENNLDCTTQFAAYEFQFENGGAVTAYKTSNSTSGIWIADISTRTIFAKFPISNDTLKKLNDTWKVYNNTLTLVEANPTDTGRSAYLKLVKK
jgi:hypothetical protein